MTGPTPREFLTTEAGIRADNETELRRADRLAAIPIPPGGFSDAESHREAAGAKRPDDRAVRFLEAHKARVIKLPKDMREKAELAITLAGNVREVERLKDDHKQAVAEAQRKVDDHLAEQALAGTLPNDWDWNVEWTGPTVSKNQLDLAAKATRDAKRRADQAFRAATRYNDVRPMLEEAWKETVEFDADPAEISHLEFHKLTVKAEKGAEALRSINASYVDDPKQRREVTKLSEEREGLVHLGDYKLAKDGKITFADIRCRPGDAEPKPKVIEAGPEPVKRQSMKEAAARDRSIVAKKQKAMAVTAP